MDLKTMQSGERLCAGKAKRRRKKRMIGLLSAAVALCTVYLLILPAVTLDSEPGTATDWLHETSDAPREETSFDEGSLAVTLVPDAYSGDVSDSGLPPEEVTEDLPEDSQEQPDDPENVSGEDGENVASEQPEQTGPQPGEDDGVIVLTAQTESGITVTVSGRAEFFPADGEITLAVKELSLDGDEDAAERLERIGADMIEDDIIISAARLFDITLLANGTEFEPSGTLDVTFSGLCEEVTHVCRVTDDSVTRLDPTKGDDKNGLRFETDHFSVYGLITGQKSRAAGDTARLYVTKEWSDVWSLHDPVTVTLMRKLPDGTVESTGRTMTLGGNGIWTDFFDSLELPAAGEDFSYYVVESSVPNYLAQYSEPKKIEGVNRTYWVPVEDNIMRIGENYVIRSGNYIMDVSNGSDMNALQVCAGGSIELGGTVYPNYLANVPPTAVFRPIRVSNNNARFKILNVSSNRYLRGDYLTSPGDSGRGLVFTFTNGVLNCDRGNMLLTQVDGVPVFRMSGTSSSQFQIYKQITVSASANEYEAVVKNTKLYPQQGIIDSDPELHKQIDYLGDGATNPDTEVQGSDIYRIYLDILGSHQPVDLLIVSDVSSSMSAYFSDGMTRRQALDQIVNGTIISGSGANAVRDTDGIIYNFIHMHPENKVAVTCFSGGYDQLGQTYEGTKGVNNQITLGWTGRGDFPNNAATPRDCYARVVRSNEPGGTNYTSALLRAEEMLQDPAIAEDGHIKVMIFLTDGEPNRAIDENGVIVTDYAPNTYTKNKFVAFTAAHPNMVTYIVGISEDANTGNAYALLSTISRESQSTYYPADTAGYLRAVLREIIDRSKFSLVEIDDELSRYVELHSECPDVKVIRTDVNGVQTVVWENGGPTPYNFDSGGVRIVQSVEYTPSSSGDSTGKISLRFNPDCLLDGENRFELSYNVHLTDAAREEYYTSGYDSAGDADTDFGSNSTSSGKAGFQSNHNATVSFTAYDIGHEIDYPHPVVQVEQAEIKIKKIDSVSNAPLAGAEFELYRACGSAAPGAVQIPGLTSEYGITYTDTALASGTDGVTPAFTLPYGSYYLVETKPPDGCLHPEKPLLFTLSASAKVFAVSPQYGENASFGAMAGDTFVINVTNDPSFVLPETGGGGAWQVYRAGIALFALAAALVILKKQK